MAASHSLNMCGVKVAPVTSPSLSSTHVFSPPPLPLSLSFLLLAHPFSLPLPHHTSPNTLSPPKPHFSQHPPIKPHSSRFTIPPTPTPAHKIFLRTRLNNILLIELPYSNKLGTFLDSLTDGHKSITLTNSQYISKDKQKCDPHKTPLVLVCSFWELRLDHYGYIICMCYNPPDFSYRKTRMFRI